MRMLYGIYCCFLWLWTNESVAVESAQQKVFYVVLVTGLIGMGWLASELWQNNKGVLVGVYLALILANLGASIAYRTGEKASWSYFTDVHYMVIAFAAVYLIVRYTKIYRWCVFQVLIAVCLPLIPILARLTTEEKNGAYLNIGEVQIFGLILMGYVFVAAFFLTLPEKKYLLGDLRTVSLNLVGLLAYTFLLYIGCAICNELGLLLILGLTSSVLFFVRCKNWLPKIMYSSICLAGAILVAKTASHVRDRVQIWLNLKNISELEVLKAKAETVLYLFRSFKRTGWWGNGIGDLPQSIYKTLNSDHALVTLFHDYGAIFAFVVILVSALFVKFMLFEREGLPSYDRYLNLASALVVGFIVLVHIASNLGSFITAGQGFPWVSDGVTTNVMFTVMLAIHCGLNGRKGGNFHEDDEEIKGLE